MPSVIINLADCDMDTLVSSMANEANGDFKEVHRKHPRIDDSATEVDGVYLEKSTALFAKQLRKYNPSLRVGIPVEQIQERLDRGLNPIYGFAYVYRPCDMYVMGAIGYGTLGDAQQQKYLIKSNAVRNNMFKSYNKLHRCKASGNLDKALQNAMGYFHKPDENKASTLLTEDYIRRTEQFIRETTSKQARKMADVVGSMLKTVFHLDGLAEGYHSVISANIDAFSTTLGRYASGRDTKTGALFECRNHYKEVADTLPENIMGSAADEVNKLFFEFFRLVDAKFDLRMVYANKDGNGELSSYNISTIGTGLKRGTLDEDQLTAAFKATQVPPDEVDTEIASKVATLSMLDLAEYTPTVGVRFKGDIFFIETNVEELGDEYYENNK